MFRINMLNFNYVGPEERKTDPSLRNSPFFMSFWEMEEKLVLEFLE